MKKCEDRMGDKEEEKRIEERNREDLQTVRRRKAGKGREARQGVDRERMARHKR